ncbi:OsmC family protein [Cellulomonas sp. ATA003]|uniref:OsmC family protein n=1 Tax=Cellulomonas sp. ATA003 TaxID=3073064 RepID=UPI002872D7B0|nr:OsmC family protein [Cellulomonas sp. ATA003]WNB86531.1 OsmC family protein [Cellulomonas sp. ATA003]
MTTSTSAPTAAPAPDGPRLKTLRADGVWEGRQRTRLTVRHFDLATGEPEKVGGDDSAPTPMELILAGLDGCLAVVVETVAGELGLGLHSLALHSEAVMDSRGFGGVPGVRPYYQDVRTRVEVGLGEHTPDDVARLQTSVEARCPALTLIRAADVDARVEWVVR